MTLVFFIFGVALGSFFNVVSTRYRGEGRIFNWKKIGGFEYSENQRSRCLACGKKLLWIDLIPIINFSWLRGCCRYCKEKLSWQYPIIELAGGLAMLAPLFFYDYFKIPHRILLNEPVMDYYLLVFIWLVVALAMLLVIAIDWRLQIIPDQINIFLAFWGLVIAAVLRRLPDLDHGGSFTMNYFSIFPGSQNIFLNHILGGIAGLAVFALIIFASKGKAMGMGDMKLAGAMGLIIGWPDIILAIVFSFVIGSLWGVILLLTGRKTLKEKIPFGPFLVIGFFTFIIWGHSLLSWYFKII